MINILTLTINRMLHFQYPYFRKTMQLDFIVVNYLLIWIGHGSHY